MAHVQILSAVMINGEPAAAGSLVDVSDSDAQYLIGMGLAVMAEAPTPEPEVESKPARTRKHSPED
jgi:hypothetical protein